MLRTSIILPTELHQQLLFLSQKEQRSVNSVINEILQQSLQKKQKQSLSSLYQAIKTQEGKGGTGSKNASQSIDQIVYGI